MLFYPAKSIIILFSLFSYIFNYDTQNTHYVFDSLKRIGRMIAHVFLFHVLSQGLFN